LDRRFSSVCFGLFAVTTILGIAFAALAFITWYLLRGRDAGPRSSALPAKTKGKTKKNAKTATRDAAIAKARLNKQLDPATAPKTTKKNSRRRSFKGAAINICENSCEASKALAGKRFLVEHAPRLPLEGCDRLDTCVCKYHNYPDRRLDDERRNVYGALSTVGEIGMQASNKRTGMDRRSSSLDSELDRIEVD
jgi:hypothetical protein